MIATRRHRPMIPTSMSNQCVYPISNAMHQLHEVVPTVTVSVTPRCSTSSKQHIAMLSHVTSTKAQILVQPPNKPVIGCVVVAKPTANLQQWYAHSFEVKFHGTTTCRDGQDKIRFSIGNKPLMMSIIYQTNGVSTMFNLPFKASKNITLGRHRLVSIPDENLGFEFRAKNDANSPHRIRILPLHSTVNVRYRGYIRHVESKSRGHFQRFFQLHSYNTYRILNNFSPTAPMVFFYPKNNGCLPPVHLKVITGVKASKSNQVKTMRVRKRSFTDTPFLAHVSGNKTSKSHIETARTRIGPWPSVSTSTKSAFHVPTHLSYHQRKQKLQAMLVDASIPSLRNGSSQSLFHGMSIPSLRNGGY